MGNSFFHEILSQTIDTRPLLAELEKYPNLWDQNNLRTTFENTPHSEVSDIWLRFNSMDSTNIPDEKEAIDYAAYHMMPIFRKTVMAVLAYVGGERLGRVLITKLPPGGRITPHADQGGSPEYYERFHVPLQGGGWFRCQEEVVRMKTGDLWWVQNLVEHEVLNDSNQDRLHLIIDARCANWYQSITA